MYDVTPAQPANGLTVAELFAGGGLMALGLKMAGFAHVWANDADKRAVRAYQYNLGDHIVLGDITEIDPDDIPDVDVIAGGPPCQDYSVAGKGAGENGKNGKLVWSYLRIIERKQPRAFIFENVKGLIGKRHRPTFDALLAEFSGIGYEVSWQLINAWDYGVAQKRERVFIVGVRKDLGFTFEFPTPDPADYRTQVLRDVIGDLPDPGGKERNPQDGKYSSRYLSRNRVIPWDSPAHTVLASARDISIHPMDGSITMDHVRNHEPKALNEKQIAFLDRNPTSVKKNRPVSMGEPSRTLPAVIHKGVPYGLYIPKDKIRRFTVRECLRIQSAPDWYVFPDDISLSAQYRIVGNGVACRVAWYLGRALAAQLKEDTK